VLASSGACATKLKPVRKTPEKSPRQPVLPTMPISVVTVVVMPVMSIRMVIIDVARIVDVVSVTRILAVIRPVMVKAESKSYMHSSLGLMKCTASIYMSSRYIL
jgi:hypothetical protein